MSRHELQCQITDVEGDDAGAIRLEPCLGEIHLFEGTLAYLNFFVQ